MEEVELGQKACPECGEPSRLSARYCWNCGIAFPSPERSSPVAWQVVHKWRDHYAEDGRRAATPQAALAAFNLTHAGTMDEMGHLSFVVARLESTDDNMVFRVLEWWPLVADRAAGEYVMGDPEDVRDGQTIRFSNLESAQVPGSS